MDLNRVIEETRQKLLENPQRRMDICERYVQNDQKRPYPCIFLNVGQNPSERRAVRVTEHLGAKERLCEKLCAAVAPLGLNNPVVPYLVLGVGPGTLVASFGLPLDAALDHTPRGYKTADELLAAGVPDPETSGLFPQMREDIETIRAYTSDFFRIEKPDMQGPFNLAHAIVGTEIFVLPFIEPQKYHAVMRLITEFYIRAEETLRNWIGDRGIAFPRRKEILAECSCNLVSSSFYEDNVLPYDLQICKYYGETAVHPCSGPHVFYNTLRRLPNVVYTEAGEMLAPMAAGCIAVRDALQEIGERPIVLNIGQELPEGREYEFIRADLDLAKTNNRLLFGYTGTHFREKDIPHILDIHQRLDDYWAEHIYREGN